MDWLLTEEIDFMRSLRLVVDADRDTANLLPDMAEMIGEYPRLHYAALSWRRKEPANSFLATLAKEMRKSGDPIELHLMMGRVNAHGAEAIATMLESERFCSDKALLLRPIVGLNLEGTQFTPFKATTKLAAGLAKNTTLAYFFARSALKLAGQTKSCAEAITAIDICAGEMQSNLNLVETDLGGEATQAERFLKNMVNWNRDAAQDFIERVQGGERLHDPEIEEMRARRFGIAQVLRSEKDHKKRRDFWIGYRRLTGEEKPPMAHVGENNAPWPSNIISLAERRARRALLKTRL